MPAFGGRWGGDNAHNGEVLPQFVQHLDGVGLKGAEEDQRLHGEIIIFV